MRVRTAIVDDADRIARVHVASWQAAYEGILPAEFLAGLSVERRAQRWREILAMDAASTVVIEGADGVVIGFASIGPGPEPGVGELQALYLLPDSWGRGQGRFLIRAAEDGLRVAGFESAVLWVFRDNQRARRFYAAAGWVEDGGLRLEEIGGVQPAQLRYRRRLDQSSQP